MKKKCLGISIALLLCLGGCSSEVNKVNTNSQVVQPKKHLYYKTVYVLVTDVVHTSKFVYPIHYPFTQVKVYNKQYNLTAEEEFQGDIYLNKGDTLRATLWTEMIDNEPAARWLENIEEE